ncbi:hypothetical protein GCM10028801_35490 [Nocardioides maradonensis]
MFKRATLGGVLAATLAATTLGLIGPASANTGYTVDPDDTTGFTPVAGDLIGVGSDTIQHAIKLVADAYDSTNPSARVFTYSATVKDATTGAEVAPTASDTIPLPDGTSITRPNGSGAGRALLGPTGNSNIDFARASSSMSATDASNGLQQFPFAIDTLGVAVANTSNAPANLTINDLVNIYNGTYTTWNQIPGNAAGSTATIVPMRPQANSGTAGFFDAQLKAANNNTAITYSASVQTVQEHDPTPIEGNPNAIAPFSVGRASILPGSPIHIENTDKATGGWSAKRALYDVVRGADASNPAILAMFGPNGFLCSDPAYDLIKKAGFEQMARPDAATPGDCGLASQTASTNFTANVAPTPVATTTTVTGTSTTAGKATLEVNVTSGSGTPTGKVDIMSGSTVVASGLNLIGGQVSQVVTNAPGAHSYTATYTHNADTLFTDSSASKSVVTKAASKITETFPLATKVGARAKGVVTVDLVGSATVPTGKVVVKMGTKVVGSGTLSATTGKVTLTLIKMPKGKHTLVASWAGNAYGLASSLKFTVTQK